MIFEFKLTIFCSLESNNISTMPHTKNGVKQCVSFGEMATRSNAPLMSSKSQRHLRAHQEHVMRLRRRSEGPEILKREIRRNGVERSLKIGYSSNEEVKKFRNKLGPFWTMGKPTCGVRFSRETDHQRKKLDIKPANLPQWRTTY